MNYQRRYSKEPEIVKKLDRIKYMIYSVGGLDTSVEIDFDLDFISGTGVVHGFTLYVKKSNEISGFMSEVTDALKTTTKKITSVFDKIKLDDKLNISKTAENFFSDEPMIVTLNFDHFDSDFEYELMFLFEITG